MKIDIPEIIMNKTINYMFKIKIDPKLIDNLKKKNGYPYTVEGAISDEQKIKLENYLREKNTLYGKIKSVIQHVHGSIANYERESKKTRQTRALKNWIKRGNELLNEHGLEPSIKVMNKHR